MGPLILALGAALAAPSAQHDGQREGDSLVWTSTIPVKDGCIALAAPLEGALVEGATVRGDQLCFPDQRAVATLTTRQSYPDEALRPPLVAGMPQRVRLRGARYEPDDALGLVHGTRAWWSPGLDPRERKALDRDPYGARAPKTGTRIYLVPDGSLARTGLSGRVSDGRSPWTAAGLIALLMATLGGLWGAHRMLERFARRERVEAWLAENGEDPVG